MKLSTLTEWFCELLFAVAAVAGILALLDLLYHFWVLWFIPEFAEHPAGLCLACAAVLLLVVFLISLTKGGEDEF